MVIEKRHLSNDGMPARTARLWSQAGAGSRRVATRESSTTAATRIIAIRSCNTRAFCRRYKELLCERSFHQRALAPLTTISGRKFN